jgi:hypothetical protein
MCSTLTTTSVPRVHRADFLQQGIGTLPEGSSDALLTKLYFAAILFHAWICGVRLPAGSGTPLCLGLIGEHVVQTALIPDSLKMVGRSLKIRADIQDFQIPSTPNESPQLVQTRPVLETAYVERRPSYSTDGSRIAFVSNRTGRRPIWVSDAAGKSAVEWTQNLKLSAGPPSWSPDGTRIAFADSSGGRNQIEVLEVRTRTLKLLTEDSRDYAHAAWPGRTMECSCTPPQSASLPRACIGSQRAEATPN